MVVSRKELDGIGGLTLVLTPLAVAVSLVVDTGQEVEILKGYLLLLDAQFLVKFALSGPLDSHNRIGKVGASLSRHAQGVGAAGIGPHIGEGDFLRRALLEKELILVVEKEDRESPVKKALLDVCHEVAWNIRAWLVI